MLFINHKSISFFIFYISVFAFLFTKIAHFFDFVVQNVYNIFKLYKNTSELYEWIKGSDAG